MTEQETKVFAKLLIRQVRDAAIQSADNQLYAQNPSSPVAKRWKNAREAGEIDQFAQSIIADTVDDTIFYFLRAIDEGFLNLSFQLPDGGHIALNKDIIGELGGWYMGEWRSTYSAERCADDLEGI